MAAGPDPDVHQRAVPGAAVGGDRSARAGPDPPDDPESAAPVLFVADADPEARRVTECALLRRFAPDYRVVTAGSADSALETLQGLAHRGERVALMAVDLRLPGTNGVDLLQRAHEVYPTATRVVLVAMDRYRTRVPFEELETLRGAIALGRIDFWIMKGWTTPEEWLYPQIQESLSAWTMTHIRKYVLYRIVGEQWAPRSHELRDGLTRNGIPFAFYPVDSPAGQQLVRDFPVDVSRLPAVISHDGAVLHDPTIRELGGQHGIDTKAPPEPQDLVILGAGPAGIAAGVYGASEGLRTLIVESLAIGGQAGTSSMIRNYLGFPRGIGGAELAHRAWEQAVLLGAHFVFTHPVVGLRADGEHRVLELADGDEVTARTVIIAAGVTYRRLQIPALERLIGVGVFYGAAGSEAPALAGQQVYVVGGANSAGQAALHLAKYAAHVTLVIRGPSMAAGMSDYLVRQIEATRNVSVRLDSRIVDARGTDRLEALTVEDVPTGARDDVPAAAVFVLIGAEPRTDWLRDVLRLDDRGFILTGRDVPPDAWPLTRPPLPFETSLPGVFAAGDVRYGSVKRVAGAVGEGSVSVGSVHQYLAGPET
jgi:thioredoxin reductase (NADPH)